ncbi:M4 family metallopeptidase [Cytophaga hutchinsonii]|uniref:Uncharacterized protein n=1 Tax=Cytophaga hutchinsonii (strain ATCC 33406 / DSM 1761 / CIP 103989 / NBRC 15051 / NCIMB 9469 / D465) TaxID=269798 RepID=A0A6N4SQ56_CYTH3|nr:M4 family metallopeptidase [Cytophaga hutchinsonii]ABG58481.1 conserved hypothetical protein; possible metalloprotease [Cytophaga hutchinsonii ATCC 33406]SFX75342.1 Por secretion system C-terminal sorting domain-containing protein [Cytophaga hutchinsonii ATCC 33406]
MKKPYSTLFLLLLTATHTFAQTSFDVKEKQSNPAAHRSFEATRIKGNMLQQSILTAQGTSLLPQLSKPNTAAVRATAKNPFSVIYSNETGLPIFIKTIIPQTLQQRAVGTGSGIAIAYNYIDQLRETLGLTDVAEPFTPYKTEKDLLGGQIIRLKQFYNGIEIDGCESIVHINASGQAVSWNGSYIKPDLIKHTSFAVTPAAAAAKALADIKTHAHYVELSEQEQQFLNYSTPGIKQIYYIDDKLVRSCVPAYSIDVRPNFLDWWEYIIDAQTGNILSSHSKTCHADGPRISTGNDLNGVSRTINTYQTGSLYYTTDASRSMFKSSQSSFPDNPAGAIQTLDLNYTYGSNTKYKAITSSTNSFNATAISAHYIAGKSYDYYSAIHGRTSIDGNGGTIISFINVADPDDGTPMDNAFWNGKAMYYGNGNTNFKPLAGGLDVGGHELTHGVIQNSANLNYQGESGAINESMADIFGCMIDSLDWKIGEDVVLLSKYPSGALRDLSNPHNGGTNINSRGWQPAHVSEKYSGTQDNGGVHINSGITNYAFYLLAQSTSRSKAEKIFYRALTAYLTRSSKFIDLRIACIAAATDLYTSNEATKTGIAFDQVGITGNSEVPTTPVSSNLPVNTGDEYLLTYNLNTTYSTKLYRINTATQAYATINTSSVFNKPSITDDGSMAYFVNTANQLKSLYLTPGNTYEQIIQDEPIWNNVAISKNGKRLAATTTDKDTSVYVYDFDSDTWAQFVLYNPTYSEGIKSGGPIYADALEWDHTGEFLVYDCYNEFENTSGNNINFWDINFIQVWDNTLNDFGDGTVTKLFSSLPDHISVGNPAFAKNSTNIIAFDYIDEDEGDLYVIGCNTETNELDVITSSNVLGFPNFNRLDNKIAYLYELNSDHMKSIWTVDLDESKITALPNGSDTYYTDKSNWPVYYATGVRSLPSSTTAKHTNTSENRANVYPNPASADFSIRLTSGDQSHAVIHINSTTGQLIYSTAANLLTGENTIPVQLPASVASGYYIVTIETADERWVSKLIKK